MFPQGRVVRAAILMTIMDMLAARQATGFPAVTARNFCITCKITLDGIHSVDPQKWKIRDWEKLLQHAKEWRDAENLTVRDKLWKKTQMRWSSLNDLPYWNPVELSVGEAMHLDLLNNVHHFIRFVWGVDTEVEGGDGSTPDIIVKRPDQQKLQQAVNDLNTSASSDIFKNIAKGLGKPILTSICYDNRLPFGGNHSALVSTLVEFVSRSDAYCGGRTPDYTFKHRNNPAATLDCDDSTNELFSGNIVNDDDDDDNTEIREGTPASTGQCMDFNFFVLVSLI